MPVVAHNTYALAFLCATFGFSFASAYVLIPKIAELIVGVDNFGSAIGLNFFMQGLGLLVGTPFAGWIFEVSERFVCLKYFIEVSVTNNFIFIAGRCLSLSLEV